MLLYTATKKGKNNLSLNISTTPALAQKLALISAQQELQKSQDIKASSAGQHPTKNFKFVQDSIRQNDNFMLDGI